MTLIAASPEAVETAAMVSVTMRKLGGEGVGGGHWGEGRGGGVVCN
jgi:hypothetical protein